MAQQQQRYRIIERIAAGGMAEVYRAESAGLEGFKKLVAIKRVLPHLAEKKQFIGMFLDEARTSANLSHSNCAQVFDIGVGDNTYFIVMEFVDGADLKAVVEHLRMRGKKVPTEIACFICERICEGLSYAHEAKDTKGQPLGIVHRDMSPPNVLITRHGEIKIVDFGLAKANSQLERSEPGIIKGKFSYLSPEAALGQPVDARTDVFAVAIMLWEMLTGRRLFMGETDIETVRQVQAARVPPARQYNPDVPPELDQLLAKGLAREPERRYQTAREFGRDINALMFRLPRPVSSFDVASIVQEVCQTRDTERNRRRPADQASIIGSLIDEAMLEFTSLQRGSGPKALSGGRDGDAGAPLNIGSFGEGSFGEGSFGESGDEWGDLDLGRGKVARPRKSSDSYHAGNLAALEDDAPGISLASARRQGSATGAAARPSAPAAAPSDAAPGGSGGLIAVLMVLLALGGVAGTYFGGFVPAFNQAVNHLIGR